ncbi:uncharacterized protein B0P05DRAFT_525781 [Gilbertella persicaria]|uniref:uncharacterized protein n=1 Tax=Gilbertella persicaria TaxID=101096 RepID=UPI00221F4BDD|nr:uncharacterized protein B0P05DRAFT_525781 [Gilbertella persicaria]KAI8092313.1 hypothetical protein B0P05DRAFT_525781 [Gilbertella persicaria]
MDFNQTKNTSKATGYQHCVIILVLVVIAFVLLNVVHNLKEVSALSAIYHITMIAATGIFGIVSEKYLQEKKNKLVDLLQVIEADLSGLKEATNKYNVLLEDETMNLMKSLKSTLFLVDRNPEDSKEIKQVELETEGSMDHCKKLIDVYQQISKRAHNSCILIKKVVLENQ